MALGLWIQMYMLFYVHSALCWIGNLNNTAELAERYKEICGINSLCLRKEDDMTNGIKNKTFPNCPPCSCLDDCHVTGSCCPDTSLSECVPTRHFINNLNNDEKIYYKIVSHCPSRNNRDLAERCLLQIDESNFVDQIPVTSKQTNVTYASKKCAECHEDTDVLQWKFDITCQTRELDFSIYSNFSEIWSDMQLYNCTIEFKPPLNAISRPCKRESLIRECNFTGHWERYELDIETACKIYWSPFGIFQNVFCFLCNTGFDQRKLTFLSKTNEKNISDSQNNGENCESTFHTSHFTQCPSVSSRENMKIVFSDAEIMLSEKYNTSLRIYIANLMFLTSKLESIVKEMSSQEDLNTTSIAQPKINLTSLFREYVSSGGYNDWCDEDHKLEKIFPGFKGRRACSCDQDCYKTFQCCPDAAYHQTWSCVRPSLGTFQIPFFIERYFLISRCPVGYNNSYVRYMCERFEDFDLLNIPITDIRTNEAYLNYFCLLCNTLSDETNHSFPHLQLWNITLVCPQIFWPAYLPSLKSVLDSAKQNSCSLYFTTTFQGNECYQNSPIGKCNATGLISFVSKDALALCEDPKMNIMTQSKNLLFKNLICDVCNNAIFEDPISKCNVTGMWDANTLGSLNGRFKRNVNALLGSFIGEGPEWDTNDPSQDHEWDSSIPGEDGTNIGNDFETSSQNNSGIVDELTNVDPSYYVQMCKNGEYGDGFYPYKNSFCELCNINRRFGGGQTGSLHTYRQLFSILEVSQGGKKSTTKDCSSDEIYDSYQMKCRRLHCSKGKFLHRFSCIPLIKKVQLLEYNLAFKVLISFKFGTKDLASILGSLSEFLLRELKTGNFMYMNILQNHFYVQKPCQYLKVPQSDPYSENEALVYLQFQIIDKYELIDRSQVEEKLLNFRKWNIELGGISLSFQEEIMAWYLPNRRELAKSQTECIRHNYVKQKDNSGDFHAFDVNKLLQCPQIQLEADEFTFSESNLQVFVKAIRRHFSINAFSRGNDGSIRICSDLYSQISEKTSLTETVLAVATFGCTIISLICLLLTFLCYCSLPILRTVPGKNIMCFSFSLFFAQLLFLVRSYIDDRFVCAIIGCFTHYFWVSVFVCTNVCCVHMFKLFVSSSFVHSDKSNDMKLTIQYCLFAYLLPLLPVVLNIFLDYMRIDGNNFGYGGSKCFLVSSLALLVTFIVPIILQIACNIVIFSVTFHQIRKSPKVQSSQQRDEFSIFWKMFVLTGTSWVLMIIDGFFELSPFTFLVTIMNGSQGIFLFLSYSCNKKVLKMLKKKWSNTSIQRTSTGDSTYLHSSKHKESHVSDITKTTEMYAE